MPEEGRPRWPGRLPATPAPVGPSSGEGERGPVLLGRYALTRTSAGHPGRHRGLAQDDPNAGSRDVRAPGGSPGPCPLGVLLLDKGLPL